MPGYTRRKFLQQSAMAASAIAVLRTPANGLNSIINESPVASTTYGKVRGYTDNNINVFKGIPYGADTSSRRFQAPVPPEKWSDIREAVEYGPSSPQRGREGQKMSEDCLVLNVFTPALRDKVKRPVMFYIHGGAYSGGSGSSLLYDGVRLCNRGNVV